jgi:hypothetical protein
MCADSGFNQSGILVAPGLVRRNDQKLHENLREKAGIAKHIVVSSLPAKA